MESIETVLQQQLRDAAQKLQEAARSAEQWRGTWSSREMLAAGEQKKEARVAQAQVKKLRDRLKQQVKQLESLQELMVQVDRAVNATAQ